MIILEALKWLVTEILKAFSSEAIKQLFQKLFKNQETSETGKEGDDKFEFTNFPHSHQENKYEFKDLVVTLLGVVEIRYR
jgi:hypothetical protein